MVFRRPQIRAYTRTRMNDLEANVLNRALLAPGAGAGIGKLIAEQLLAQPDFVQKMTALVDRAIHAKSPRRWDKDTQTWIQDDDMRTQIQTFFGLLAHMEGEPIKRIIHQHLGAEKGASLTVALRESPALLGAVKREVEKAEWMDVHASRAQRAAKAQSTEIEAPSELPAE